MRQTAKKVISFAGTKRGDIVYYTAKTLAVCNEPVLVIDNSRQHDVFNALRHPREDARDVIIRNITYVRDADFSPAVLNDFQYIVVYHGTNVSLQWWQNSDIRFVTTDFDKFNIEEAGKAFKDADADLSNVIPVFFNRFSTKIKDKTVLDTLGIEPKEDAVAFELEADESSNANWTAFQYNGSQKLTKLSRQMGKVVYSIYTAIVGKKDRLAMQKLFKQAK